ncbi:MAG: spore coat associated protein CotJA [Clostridia bacterium]
MCDCFESTKNAYCSISIPGIDTPRGDLNDMDLVYRPVTKLPANPMVTMAYVPFQEDVREYDSEKALMQGTAFPDLDKPFYGKVGCRR